MCLTRLPEVVNTTIFQECTTKNAMTNDLLMPTGEVMGIHCTQRIEDLLRQKMDATIKEIAPQVFPHTYTIDFIPVRDIADVAIGEIGLHMLCGPCKRNR